MSTEEIIDHRVEETNDELVWSDTCKVQQHSQSLYGCLTKPAEQRLNLAKGDELEVNVYQDRVVMRRADDE